MSALPDVSVGAGAQIQQGLALDPNPPDFYRPEPSAIIRLYFVFEDVFQKIVAQGREDLEGDPEGFLSGLPTG
jgi:hypothetical protein